MLGPRAASGGGRDSATHQQHRNSDDGGVYHHLYTHRDAEPDTSSQGPSSRSPSASQDPSHLDASQIKQLPLHPPPSYSRLPDSGAHALPPIKSLADHDGSAGHNNTSTTLPSFATLTASTASVAQQAPAARSSPSAVATATVESQSTPSSSSLPHHPPPAHWPSLNPFSAYYTPSYVQAADSPSRMDLDMTNTGSGGGGGGGPLMNPASPDRFLDGRSSSVSLDDPDVRLAAEALGDLKAGKLLASWG